MTMPPPEELGRHVDAALQRAREGRARILRHDRVTVRRELARAAMQLHRRLAARHTDDR